MYYENLKKNLFTPVEYPAHIKDLVQTVSEKWKEFCTISDEDKEKVIFPEHQQFDVGYKRRLKSQGREDKEYFHFSQMNNEFVDAYPEAKNLVATNPKVSAFFDSAQKLHKEIEDFITDFAVQLERESEGVLTGLGEDVKKNISKQNIRFLHYTPDTETPVMGGAHFDRGGFTLHLYESKEGLQLLPLSEKSKESDDMVWIDAPMSENQTIIFTGYMLSKLSQSELKYTWHRVEQKGGDSTERYSIVMFVDTSLVDSYDVNERSQNLAHGSGY